MADFRNKNRKLFLINGGHCSRLGTLAKVQYFPFRNMKISTFILQFSPLYFPQLNLQTIRDCPDLYLYRFAFQLVRPLIDLSTNYGGGKNSSDACFCNLIKKKKKLSTGHSWHPVR